VSGIVCPFPRLEYSTVHAQSVSLAVNVVLSEDGIFDRMHLGSGASNASKVAWPTSRTEVQSPIFLNAAHDQEFEVKEVDVQIL
jgi:hypothetical protein